MRILVKKRPSIVTKKRGNNFKFKSRRVGKMTGYLEDKNGRVEYMQKDIAVERGMGLKIAG